MDLLYRGDASLDDISAESIRMDIDHLFLTLLSDGAGTIHDLAMHSSVSEPRATLESSKDPIF